MKTAGDAGDAEETEVLESWRSKTDVIGRRFSYQFLGVPSVPCGFHFLS
jgi:hypothetical protein